MDYGLLDWSRDGRLIVFSHGKSGAADDLWVLPLFGDRKPFPYLTTPFSEGTGALAPNGRWLAYVSDEPGTPQVIVQPFPDPSGGKWQISRQGGTYPRWRRDGRELYYLDRGGRIVAVSVTTDGNFEVGKSTPLFTTSIPFPNQSRNTGSPYDVTADGQRFLMSVPLGNVDSAPITVVLNWTAVLKK